MTLNFNSDGSTTVPFELKEDVVVSSFVSDLHDNSVGTNLGVAGYIQSDPSNLAGGLSDNSVDDKVILICDRDCEGQILRKGMLFFQPGTLGRSCLCQLRYDLVSAVVTQLTGS